MTHPLDGNTHAINAHLASLERPDAGDQCPHGEDSPRGWRCTGTLEETDDGALRCDTCDGDTT